MIHSIRAVIDDFEVIQILTEWLCIMVLSNNWKSAIYWGWKAPVCGALAYPKKHRKHVLKHLLEAGIGAFCFIWECLGVIVFQGCFLVYRATYTASV